MLTVVAVIGASALAIVLWQIHRGRQAARWLSERQEAEARLARMAERQAAEAARPNGHVIGVYPSGCRY